MTPVVGSIACFQPGSNGADAVFGHVAVVIAVSGNSFVVSEMNGPAGPGHTDDRGCTNGPGVSYLVENAPTPPAPQPPTSPPMEDDMLYLFNTGEPGIWCLYFGRYFHVTPDDIAAFEALAVKGSNGQIIQIIGAAGHATLLATYPAP
jgi:hypothetical protein